MVVMKKGSGICNKNGCILNDCKKGNEDLCLHTVMFNSDGH